MQKKIVSFFFAVVSLLLLSAGPGHSQTVQRLGGTVMDQYGNPVAGAAVLVTGSNKYAVSGDDGYWIIEGVAANATLSVSCLGYEDATIPVNGQSFINVVLNESSIMLEIGRAHV